jgi:hypothetical protein
MCCLKLEIPGVMAKVAEPFDVICCRHDEGLPAAEAGPPPAPALSSITTRFIHTHCADSCRQLHDEAEGNNLVRLVSSPTLM